VVVVVIVLDVGPRSGPHQLHHNSMIIECHVWASGLFIFSSFSTGVALIGLPLPDGV
jgi:hypothetical protein